MQHRGHGRRNNAYRGVNGLYASHNRGRSQPSHNSRPRQQTEFNVQQDIALIEEVGNMDEGGIRIAVQGCSHGCIDKIYDILEEYQISKGPTYKIDLLLCCGDFQALRNTADYETISIPPKYKEMGSFHYYYSGAKIAPILTIFIGGNHEASGYLQELYYGGWVAPNIYYLGQAGVVSFRGIRIAGLSGIWNEGDYDKGRFEQPPYNPNSLRSIYHYRNTEVSRLKCLSRTTSNQPIDIMMTHDWPRGIERFGDTQALLRKKSFFAEEIRQNNLGSAPGEEILHILKPKWWFSAHLHVQFRATVPHVYEEQFHMRQKTDFVNDTTATTTSFIGLESPETQQTGHPPDLTDMMTQFLSLDKCLPRRKHLEILNMPCPQTTGSYSTDTNETNELCYDLDWLSILQKTHYWTSTSPLRHSNPDFTTIKVTDEDRNILQQLIRSNYSYKPTNENILAIPRNFAMTALPYGTVGSDYLLNGGKMIGNPQTDTILNILKLDHIVTVPFQHASHVDTNEINLDGY